MFKDHRASKWVSFYGTLVWFQKKTCSMKEQTLVLKGVKIMMKYEHHDYDSVDCDYHVGSFGMF